MKTLSPLICLSMLASACAEPTTFSPEEIEAVEALSVPVETPPETPLSATSAQLPELEFCTPQEDGGHWLEPSYFNPDGSACDLGPECDHVIYQCRVPASSPTEFTVQDTEDSDTDCTGAPLRRLVFVVDGAAGEIRYNQSTCAPADRATLITFSGGGGTLWRDADIPHRLGYEGRDPDGDGSAADNDYRALEHMGVRIVALRWQPGVHRTLWDLGWMSRRSGEGQTVPTMLTRPAAVAAFIAESIRLPDLPFGISGTSAGSLQSSSVLVHDIGAQVDYLGLHSGGGLAAALPYSCGRIPTDIRVNHHTGDLCFFGDLCLLHGTPSFGEPIEAIVDYMLASTDCSDSNGNVDTLWASSIGSIPWNGRLPASVGFLVNNGLLNDNILGATWAAGAMRLLLWYRTGIIGEWGNQSGFHGEVMASGHPTMAAFIAQVRDGLSL